MDSRFHFRELRREELPTMLALIHQRIAWMDQVGIRQWNVTDYDGVYPPEYFQACFNKGELFVLEDIATGQVICAGALKDQDPRWPDASEPAFYLHHLTAALNHKGAGRIFLQAAEAFAADQGMAFMRLDSAIDNPALTTYYETQGYLPVGTCIDGLYEGILRQKPLCLCAD